MRTAYLPKSILLAVLILLGAAARAAPQETIERAPIQAAIAALASGAGNANPVPANRPVRARDLLQRFYAGTGNGPAWARDGFALARQALQVLRQAGADGLTPADYEVSAPLPQSRAAPDQLARFDVELTRAMLQYLADLHGGRVPPDFTLFIDPAPRDGFDPVAHLQEALRSARLDDAVAAARPRIAPYARVRRTLAEYRQLARAHPRLAPLPPLPEGAAQLRERLVLLGDLPPDAGVGGPELQEGIRRFQLRHGLREDGALGTATMAALAVPLAQRVRQLELTLERLRWIPPLRPGPLIVVNVPAYRLWGFDTSGPSAAPQLEMRVIVGSAVRTPTPLFIGQLLHLEFNPYWNVPRSIELGEIVPKLARDPDYLRKNDMEIVARGGEAPAGGASGLAALRAGTVRVRQRPGERNVLGAVKFAMPNPMNIYLHSTSARELFNRTRRDLSHGCIRLEKPDELAQFVLRGQAGWDHASVQAAMEPGPTQLVRLAAPIPVILSYATAVTDRSGRALFAADIYGRDRKLARALGLPDAGAAAD